MVRKAALLLLPLLASACVSCGSRPFAEGGSRDLTVVTSLPPDAPEVLLLRAVLERPAIRIEDETAYAVRMATPSDARVYRARTVLFLGYGRTQVPGPLLPLERMRAGGSPFAFATDVWLRGQAVGLLWADSREKLLPLIQEHQNRIFTELDRATFATVRSRLLTLPRDSRAEERLRRTLGFGLRVPRGYDLKIDPRSHAALLLDPGPPARLLRIAPERDRDPGRPQDLTRMRAALARTFRPHERTLEQVDPILTPGELQGARRQIHGRWEDSDVSAAGPFRFYEVARGEKRYYVDLAVFAPGRPKLPYLRELQAIAETLSE